MAAEVDSFTFEPNEVIFNKGDPATYLYLIQDGSVVGEIGNDKIELVERQLFGDAAMKAGHYLVTARAGDQGCTVLAVPFDDLKAQIARSPSLVKLVFGSLLDHLQVAAKLLHRQ